MCVFEMSVLARSEREAVEGRTGNSDECVSGANRIDGPDGESQSNREVHSGVLGHCRQCAAAAE